MCIVWFNYVCYATKLECFDHRMLSFDFVNFSIKITIATINLLSFHFVLNHLNKYILTIVYLINCFILFLSPGSIWINKHYYFLKICMVEDSASCIYQGAERGQLKLFVLEFMLFDFFFMKIFWIKWVSVFVIILIVTFYMYMDVFSLYKITIISFLFLSNDLVRGASVLSFVHISNNFLLENYFSVSAFKWHFASKRNLFIFFFARNVDGPTPVTQWLTFWIRSSHFIGIFS